MELTFPCDLICDCPSSDCERPCFSAILGPSAFCLSVSLESLLSLSCDALFISLDLSFLLIFTLLGSVSRIESLCSTGCVALPGLPLLDTSVVYTNGGIYFLRVFIVSCFFAILEDSAGAALAVFTARPRELSLSLRSSLLSLAFISSCTLSL